MLDQFGREILSESEIKYNSTFDRVLKTTLDNYKTYHANECSRSIAMYNNIAKRIIVPYGVTNVS